MCEHYYEHKNDHEYIKCILCDYTEPDGCFEGLCLHDQILAVQFIREKDNPPTAL